jgi:hypothetical protein
MLDPMYTPEAGSQGLLPYYLHADYREVNGVLYSRWDFPGDELGYPWLWWEDENWLDGNFSFGDDDQDGVYDRLTTREMELVKIFPEQAIMINNNRKKAENETRALFGANGLNDKTDAFRHAYWQAMNERDCGVNPGNRPIAKMFADAHESETPTQLLMEMEMDLWNNQVGLDLGHGKIPFVHTDNYFSDIILDKLQNGSLRYLKPIWPPMFDPRTGTIINNSGDPNFWGVQGIVNAATATHGIISGVTKLVPTNK